jgi:hypothetical protein
MIDFVRNNIIIPNKTGLMQLNKVDHAANIGFIELMDGIDRRL